MIPIHTIDELERKDIRTDKEAQQALANLLNNHLINPIHASHHDGGLDLDGEILKRLLQDNIIPLAKLAEFYYQGLED